MDNVTQYKKATNWGTGYEGTIANNCRYLLVIFNIFKPKKLRYPTYYRLGAGCGIILSDEVFTSQFYQLKHSLY